MNNFNDMLSFLQGLLSNRQAMQGSQWQQGLGFGQQQLAQQNTQFGQTLAEQTAARLAAQRLAEERQRQEAQQQAFMQGEERRQTSFPYLAQRTLLQGSNTPLAQQQSQDFLTAFLNRVTPGWNPTSYFTPANGVGPIPAIFQRPSTATQPA